MNFGRKSTLRLRLKKRAKSRVDGAEVQVGSIESETGRMAEELEKINKSMLYGPELRNTFKVTPILSRS